MGNSKQLSKETIAQIVALKQSGLETKEIVEQIGVSERSVRRWCAKFYRQGGVATPTHEKRHGRPVKTSPRVLNIVKRDLESNPRLSARKVKELNPEVLNNVSVRTVGRRINKLGYTSHRCIKKPLLTRKQRRKRVEFCKKYSAWTDEQWLSVLWSDESTFTVTCNRGGNVYRKVGSDPMDPRFTCATVKWPEKFDGLGSIYSFWKV